MTATLPLPTVDRTFRALGTEVRLVVSAPDAAARAGAAERFVLAVDRRLSRFRPDSELCALNADPRPTVPVSPLLHDFVAAALAAARLSGGLVDPTLLDALEAAGYRTSLAGRAARAHEALPPARDPRPAGPDAAGRWRSVRLGRGTITRPPGLRLDLGGSGKGHAADRVAVLFDGAARWAVDCGGDVRVGGAEQVVLVEEPAAAFRLTAGAVATSSVRRRAWRTAEGTSAHHLLDPRTGAPAHTGVVSATALAPTTLEAETRAKVALLTGSVAPLAEHGGLLLRATGEVERA